MKFAQIYYDIGRMLHVSSIIYKPSTVRNQTIISEYINISLRFDVSSGISVYSNKDTRAFPIKFALAELIWILSGSDRLDHLATFNKSILNYTDIVDIDGGHYSLSAYGARLKEQFGPMIDKLVSDTNTRQACMSIWSPSEHLLHTDNLPCNVFLQFFIRGNKLNLTVTSRSSDYVTGLPIDSFHWQAILLLVYNRLLFEYEFAKLDVGHITYNIGSLHVYGADIEMLNAIGQSMYTDADEAILRIDFEDLLHACIKSTEKFDSMVSLEDLGRLLNINIVKLNTLHEIFKNRKFKAGR